MPAPRELCWCAATGSHKERPLWRQRIADVLEAGLGRR